MTISDSKILAFPDDFLWGVSTSAFQVEGLPLEINGRLSDWSNWSVQNSKITDQSNSDHACEFFKHFTEDIELARSLNMRAFRIGLNWPALRGESGTTISFDEKTIEYYRSMLTILKQNGMTTFVTLFHFCLPKWLADIGGWNNRRTISEFEHYAAYVAERLGDLVDYWLTINEPMVYVYQGYVNGCWPPGYQSRYITAFQAVRNMLEGHARAFRAIKQVCADAKVSFTTHWRPFIARNPMNPLDQNVRYYRDQVFNHLFPAAVQTGVIRFPFPMEIHDEIRAISGEIPGLKGSMDYLAINYFTREICEFQYSLPIDIFGKESPVKRRETTDLGWEIYPEGLYKLLVDELEPYKLDSSGQKRPIIITENGMATVFTPDITEGDWSLDDEQRERYLLSHLDAIHRAIQQGANVQGYLHWSLLDNFEWSDGLSARFGLVRITYPTQERILRRSGRMYAEIAGSNTITYPLEFEG